MKILQKSRDLERANPWQGETRDSAQAAGELPARRTVDLLSGGDNARQSGGIRKILVATDFSPCSTRAVEHAVALASQCGASLTLLHVIEVNPPAAFTSVGGAEALMRGLRVDAITQMARLAGALSPAQVEAQPMLVEGLPAEEIVEQSARCDLVVLGIGLAKRSWRLFAKHTTQGVIEAAACPVLVVGEGQGL
jgi:nucleotide-binding universal stress UspA family protein